MTTPTKLLVIVGPTAVGKSALAIHLAQTFHGEIIGADSRQVYRLMNIGTAKPSPADRAAVPHHLVDIINPAQTYSLALFLRQARNAIHNTKHHRNNLPILVGGTGQYIWALLEGWQVSKAKPNAKLRACLQAQAEREGSQSLYAELLRTDPETAQRIDPNNSRRVIRALELAASSRTRRAPGPRKSPPNYDVLMLGLTMERSDLYARIDERIDAQIRDGWLDEVRTLMQLGYDSRHSALSGLGYAQLMAHINGDLTLQDAIQRIKYRTHRYVRQQYNWFRLSDQRILWFSVPPPTEEIHRTISQWLQSHTTPT